MEEKYYKILETGGNSPTKKFDYAPYLPKNGRPGKWLPKIEEAKLHRDGYYISKYWNMWYSEGCRIFEVEHKFMEPCDDFGVEHQACCGQIRLLRDVTETVLAEFWKHAEENRNTAEWNTGKYNTGTRNTGNFNPGNFNTGSRNTGDRNIGDFNTGDCNTGIDNVGDNNRGSGNVGSHNTGHSNTGDRNTGSYNSGDGNVGHSNTGSFNTGSRNAGKWNVGNCHVGFFNTEEPCVRMFNKPTGLKYSDIKLPKWLNRKDCKKEFWNAPKKDVKAALNLPNFDYAIFEKITGISKEDFEKKLGGNCLPAHL